MTNKPESSMLSKLDNKVPPPIVVVFLGLGMWVLAQLTPTFTIAPHLRLFGVGIFIFLGLSIAGLGIIAFRRAKTTINPVQPEAASTVVTQGIFSYTRNPMYLGFTCLLIGWMLYLENLWAIFGVVAFILFTTRFQIIPEENILSAKFGLEYGEYLKKVRRWL